MTRPWSALGAVRRLPEARSHTVLCAEPDELCPTVASWVDHELAAGSKVLYKGWFLANEADRWGWLGHGARADARARGQLEMASLASMLERCQGTTEELWQLQRREVEDALREGWPSVAMTQESTHRRLDDGAGIAEFSRRERGYDRLALLWPLKTLCQLSLGEERAVAVEESLVVHHRDIVASTWTTSVVAGRWQVAGELDVAERDRFRAAVRGALLACMNRDVHIDLGAVRFLDSSCAEVLIDAARATVPRHRFVLHRTPALAAEMLALLGIGPEAIVLRDGDG